jgi:hypothetical protein
MTASAGPALKRLYAAFGQRVAFITLYVREAHPGERYPQAASFEQKLAHARAYQQRDQIPWPVAVDDVDGSLHRALDAKPNAAYLMNQDGTVAFRTLWSNDEAILRDGLEAGVQGRNAGERQPHLVPMVKGMGSMDEVLGLAGQQARRDVRREVPPMYLMARLASPFRPLPPRSVPFGKAPSVRAPRCGSRA